MFRVYKYYVKVRKLGDKLYLYVFDYNVKMKLEKLASEASSETMARVQKYKARMLSYANPVEFVNNMYGCHPDSKGGDYFQTVFGE